MLQLGLELVKVYSQNNHNCQAGLLPAALTHVCTYADLERALSHFLKSGGSFLECGVAKKKTKLPREERQAYRENGKFCFVCGHYRPFRPPAGQSDET